MEENVREPRAHLLGIWDTDRPFQQLLGDLTDIPLKVRSFQRNMWTENSP